MKMKKKVASSADQGQGGLKLKEKLRKRGEKKMMRKKKRRRNEHLLLTINLIQFKFLHHFDFKNT